MTNETRDSREPDQESADTDHEPAAADPAPGQRQAPWTSTSWTSTTLEPEDPPIAPPPATGPAHPAAVADAGQRHDLVSPYQETTTALDFAADGWNVADLGDDEAFDDVDHDDPTPAPATEPVQPNWGPAAGSQGTARWKPRRRPLRTGGVPTAVVAAVCAALVTAAVFWHPRPAPPAKRPACRSSQSAPNATGAATENRGCP